MSSDGKSAWPPTVWRRMPASSRLPRQAYASDVVFGAAIGMVAGRWGPSGRGMIGSRSARPHAWRSCADLQRVERLASAHRGRPDGGRFMPGGDVLRMNGVSLLSGPASLRAALRSALIDGCAGVCSSRCCG